MNDVLKAIAGRRSVRQYRRAIKDAELHAILEAGLQAPSGHNDQSWYFAVVQKREMIDEINEGSKAEMRKSNITWIVDLGKKEKYRHLLQRPDRGDRGGEKRRHLPGRGCEHGDQSMSDRRRESRSAPAGWDSPGFISPVRKATKELAFRTDTKSFSGSPSATNRRG